MILFLLQHELWNGKTKNQTMKKYLRHSLVRFSILWGMPWKFTFISLLFLCHSCWLISLPYKFSYLNHVIFFVFQPCYFSYLVHVTSRISTMLFLISKPCYFFYLNHYISYIMLYLISQPCYILCLNQSKIFKISGGIQSRWS